MREFILRARKGPTTSHFSLDEPGTVGHLEIVAHCIANALYVAGNIRSRTILHIALDGPGDPPKIVRFESDTLYYLGGFDERTLCRALARALDTGRGLSLGEEQQVDNGLFVAKKGFETLVKEKAAAGPVFYLQKKGTDVRTIAFPPHSVFVFTDHLAMPKKTDKYLHRLGARPIGAGPRMLFASHCIILVHNELDRQGLP